MITDRSYRAFGYKQGWHMSKLTQCLCAHVYLVCVSEDRNWHAYVTLGICVDQE